MLISAHIDFGRHRRRNISYGLSRGSLSFMETQYYTSTALRDRARKQLRFSSISTRPEQENAITRNCLRTFMPPASPSWTPSSPRHNTRRYNNPHHIPKSITGVSVLVHVHRLASSTHHRETHDDPSSLAERQTCNAENGI